MAAGAQPVAAGQVEEVRTRARRRLIGAAVLVLAAVIGLPMLFESKPRVVAVDTPIDVARSDGLPSVSVPSAVKPAAPVPGQPAASAYSTAEPAGITPRTPSAEEGTPERRAPVPAPESIATESAAEAGREVPPPAAKPAVPLKPPATEVARPPATKPEPRKEAPVKAKDERVESAARKADPTPTKTEKADRADKSRDDAARAKALLEGREAPAKAVKATTASAGDRFVIQVGAFSQGSSAQAAIDKVAALGLKAYAQEVDTPAGKRTRVRLGPYASREEADRAAQRLRAGGQTAAVVPQ